MKRWNWKIFLGAVFIGTIAFLIFFRDRSTFRKDFAIGKRPPIEVLITTERRLFMHEKHVSEILVKQGSKSITVDSDEVQIQDPNIKSMDLFELNDLLALRIASQDGGHSRVTLLCFFEGKLVYKYDMQFEDYRLKLGPKADYQIDEKNGLTPLLKQIRLKAG